MAKPPRDRFSVVANTYFITTRAFNGQSLFQSERTANLLLDTLLHYRALGKFFFHEFVIMPNHLHVLLTPGVETTIEQAVQFIKGGFSHRAGKELAIAREIWQRGYVDHRVRDSRDFQHHRDYIRMNPVRARLSVVPEEYAYSSAFPGVSLDPAPQGLKPIG